MNNNNKIINKNGMRLIGIMILFIGILVLSSSNVLGANVCCEKTIYGAYCQNAPVDQCLLTEGTNTFRHASTSCDAFEPCKLGCCYDSDEGVCMEKTSKKVCESNNGVWSGDEKCNIAQCKPGCCVLGKQASFVGLQRCKKLSSFYGLTTDFRTNIKIEDDCINLAQSSDEGACVYETNYERTCKFTSRQGCKEIVKTAGITNNSIKFYKDYLCSNPELSAKCGPSSKTSCVDGKDGVYFLDSCGNPANIYDEAKKNDSEYWKKVIPKELSCSPGKDNANSKTCGNCDYFLGSMCRKYEKGKDISPKTGDYVCRNLDCKTTSLGVAKKHGETWCAYDSATGNGLDVVGAQHFRHICIFGEELVEPCANYRQEQCIESSLPSTEGPFSQAGCRVNRWQDCFTQTEKEDCENSDKRDCYWLDNVQSPTASPPEGVQASPVTGYALFGGSDDSSSTQPQVQETILKTGACLPSIPPGLKFWEAGEAQSICGQGSITVQLKYEQEGLMSKSGWNCKKNCWAESVASAELINKMCVSLGDCGAYVNIAGQGNDKGFTWKIDGQKQSLSAGLLDRLRAQAKINTLGSSSGKSGGGIWGWGG